MVDGGGHYGGSDGGGGGWLRVGAGIAGMGGGSGDDGESGVNAFSSSTGTPSVRDEVLAVAKSDADRKSVV